ncbi:MAG: hypothetical protein FVQ85_16895 [Planctomycetes bacterium]|nr:hypothetical protein [Planctomycetota bacterium]
MKKLYFIIFIILFLAIPSSYGSVHINFQVDATNQALTILNPNGNERLLGGSTYTIRWEDSRSEGCGGNYLLDYSINDGNSWIPVDSNPISNTCSYDWLTPLIFSNQCLIRITDAGEPNARDTSDNSFRIYRCMSNVLGDWNGDCYADFGDFTIIAAGWNILGGTDINDLAGFVLYWLDCANPYDPYCRNFGVAMPNSPLDGALIPGDLYPPNSSYTHIYMFLSFIPGPTAVTHTGYFSDDVLDVYNRTQDANLGTPPFAEEPGWEHRYVVALPPGLVPGDPYTDTLVRGQKYYWTVDQTDALGNTFPGNIWEFTIQDFKATEPNPPNEATLVETDVLLSWLPGYGAAEHDIYMGTSWENVNNVRYTYPRPPEFLATRSEPNILVTGLAHGVKYYWRVDEVWGRCPPPCDASYYYIGDVWEFTTISGSAEPNFPADGAVIPGDFYPYNIYTPLDFIPGPTAVTHTGYFSDDFLDVYNRTQDANLGQPPYPPIPNRYWVGVPEGIIDGDPYTDSLVRGTKYYWTVDETDALGNTFPGEIWEFTIQDFKATFPNPPNEATLVETDVLLSWQPGIEVYEHDVYMGTSWEDVKNALYDIFTPPPEFLASVLEPNIAVTSLALNTTYYWRVDQVWRSPPPGTGYYHTGDVWEFTTTPSALNNDGFINLKDYAIPSNNRQKTGQILPADSHKDDLVDYKDLRIMTNTFSYVPRKASSETVKHEQTAGKKAYIPPTGTINEQGRIVDKIDWPFVNDPQVIGTWRSVDFVSETEQFTAGEKQWKGSGGRLYLKELSFMPNGETFKPWWTWTKGLVFHSGDKTAGKYTLKDIEDSTYMFFEWKSGDYTIRHRKPAYYVLKKVSDAPSKKVE